MRLGAAVSFENDSAVQSYGWRQRRPLGYLNNILNALDKLECDEIVISRIVKGLDNTDALNKYLDLLETMNVSTPVSIGGGLRNGDKLCQLSRLPCERFHFNTLFLNRDKKTIVNFIKKFGQQSIQCMLPLRTRQGIIEFYDSSKNRFINLRHLDQDFISNLANEIIVCDVDAEGLEDCFNFKLINSLQFDVSRIVAMGGVGKNAVRMAKDLGFAACLIENRLLYKENSVDELKNYAKV
jgi:phosphoribosylformimino-5-aminoimidazole carboxamide ribonucleotide (ProFAR) isomerase